METTRLALTSRVTKKNIGNTMQKHRKIARKALVYMISKTQNRKTHL
jgi:hypothetical protein